MLATGAIASSFFATQRDFVMSPGETRSLGNYTFKYLSASETVFPDREEIVAEFEVYSGDSSLGIMRPFTAFYPGFRITATRGAIRSTPVEDFYIVASEFSDEGQAVFRVLINPLVWWMWGSGPVLFLGFVIALWPHRERAPARIAVPAHARTAKA